MGGPVEVVGLSPLGAVADAERDPKRFGCGVPFARAMAEARAFDVDEALGRPPVVSSATRGA